MNNHDIDYKIYGDDMQFVEVELDPGETVIAEAGGLMMMEDGIDMETIFGDGSSGDGGLMGKLFSAGKRVLTGESLFMTTFTNEDRKVRRHVSFASPYPGKIIPMDLSELRWKNHLSKGCLSSCGKRCDPLELNFNVKSVLASSVVKVLLCKSLKVTD